MASEKWAGFTDEDIVRIKTSPSMSLKRNKNDRDKGNSFFHLYLIESCQHSNMINYSKLATYLKVENEISIDVLKC